MKPLGQNLIQTSSGMYLIRTKNLPAIYSRIITKDNKIVGTVQDIIGPIMDPHIVLKPTRESSKDPQSFLGKPLFEAPPKRRKREKKWKKKR